MTQNVEAISSRSSSIDLRVSLGRFSLANPILGASGTIGYVREMSRFVQVHRLGGVIPKTVTSQPREGNPTPRTVETPAGMLNAIGLDNDGLEYFLDNHMPFLEQLGTRLVINVSGRNPDDFATLVSRFSRIEAVSAIELNLSCPNVSQGLDYGRDPERVHEVVQLCVDAGQTTSIIAKLTPNVADIVSIAEAAQRGGADAVSLINTILGMAIHWRKRRPILANTLGGLSGPAIKPVALRMVWQVHQALPELPIIGIGGICTIDDVMEFLVAGASAVQVGTANFFEPAIAGRLLDELPSKLEEAGVNRVRDLIGSLQCD